ILNERLEKEREKKLKFIENQSKNGKKGGRPKLEKPLKSKDKNLNKPKPLKNQNPKESQKKPLEEEKEDRSMKIEDVKEKEKEILPWETENFKVQWQHWKVYKKKEFGFKFKSLQSEQAA